MAGQRRVWGEGRDVLGPSKLLRTDGPSLRSPPFYQIGWVDQNPTVAGLPGVVLNLRSRFLAIGCRIENYGKKANLQPGIQGRRCPTQP